MRITRESGQEAVKYHFLKLLFLMVEYCTGFGKGKASLDAVHAHIDLRYQGRRSKGLIIAHSTPARDQMWPDEIKQWYPELMEVADVEIICYASLKNYTGQTYDWVIGDEAHYITSTNDVFFSRNKILSLILMTGTLPDSPSKQAKLQSLTKSNILTITLDEAIANSVLNDYRIVVWLIDLTDKEWDAYYELCKTVDFAVSTGNQFFIRKAVGERMRFIYNLESKYQAACYIRDQLRAKKRRFAIFTASIEIARRLSPHCLYQGSSADDYNKFLNGEINELASIKMIQEGTNVKRLDSALMQQINSKQLNFRQKLGRMMRLNPDEQATCHVLVAQQTYDLTWLANAMKGLDSKKIRTEYLSVENYKHYT